MEDREQRFFQEQFSNSLPVNRRIRKLLTDAWTQQRKTLDETTQMYKLDVRGGGWSSK